MTTLHTGLPHAREFTAANPHVVQHRCNSPEAVGEERIELWKNCDRNIRNWWKVNHQSVKCRQVVFLEWDVVCNVPIEKLLRPTEGMVCSEIKRQEDGIENWYWFRDLPNLPEDLRDLALGVVPLGVLQLTREALDALSDERHDDLYASAIYCELRTPTLLRSLGFPIQTSESLKRVTWQKQPYPWFRRGIFHPVKKSYYFGRFTEWLRRGLGQG